MKITAAVLTRCGKPLEIIENIQLPVLKRGQVLVKIHYAGLCHSQLMEVSGSRGKDKYLPHMLGHEATATVVAIGPDVSTLKEGEVVVLSWLKGAGIDSGGTIFESSIGQINAGPVTTFSNYSIVSENRCYPLPQQIGLREGVLFGCALPTGMGMVQNQLSITQENSVGILGLGGIGMSALIAAIQSNAKLIVAIDTNEDKLKIARKIGAHAILNPNTHSLKESIEKLNQGKLLDYMVEAAGSCHTIETAFSLVHSKHGKCVFASHPKHGDKIHLDPFELICGKKIEGSWGGGANPLTLLHQAAHSEEQLATLSQFLTAEYTLPHINKALNDLSDKKVVRAIIKMDSI